MTAQFPFSRRDPETLRLATPVAPLPDAVEPPPDPAAPRKRKRRPNRIKTPPPDTVRPAQARGRHLALFFSFLLCVMAPTGGAGWYLWTRAVDQYASYTGFTVRREDAPSAGDLLGGISTFSASSSSDSDVLYEFIHSQDLVAQLDKDLNLRAMFARPAATDPIFALAPGSSIESLVRYWRRMVTVSYAPGTGLMELRVLAFAPEDAHAIATGIFTTSSEMINALSTIARDDSMRYAVEELDAAVEELKEARQRVTAFRSRTQIVDPGADIRAQMGLLSSLQEQLGRELISLDLLRGETRKSDPRIVQSERRVAAIEARIQDERRKFGVGGAVAGGRDYASLIEEYERLTVDLEFAERKYTSALTGFDTARAEAQRQSRYLAPYLRPTLAETAEHPRRLLLTGLAGLFLFLAWATLSLTGYALRDRR